MKKVISLIAILGLTAVAHAQNQYLATAPVYTNATVIAADSNAVARIIPVGQYDMTKVYRIRIADTGGFASRLAWGTQANNTNAYSGTLSNGIPLGANGSITYDAFSGIPFQPLYAKTTTNGTTTTYTIEILKRQ